MLKVSVKFDRKAYLGSLKAGTDAALLGASHRMVEDLKAATPIDTGKARASWHVLHLVNGVCTIINNVPYIGDLNRGTSKQAPAYFIEHVALRYGRPKGTITYETN